MNNTTLRYLGKIISRIELQDDVLNLRFADGTGLDLFDDGQRCCEDRYMHTDDDLSEVVGGRLYGIEIREAPSGLVDDDCDEVHEIKFLVVKTSEGDIVVCTHNVHNGWYGGISITAREVK